MSRTFRSEYHEDNYHYKGKSSRDKKKWYKAESSYKKTTKKKERAKEHDHLRHVTESDDEYMPSFKKHNDFDWKGSHYK